MSSDEVAMLAEEPVGTEEGTDRGRLGVWRVVTQEGGTKEPQEEEREHSGEIQDSILGCGLATRSEVFSHSSNLH